MSTVSVLNNQKIITIKNFGIKGFIRLQTKNIKTKKIRVDTGWFPNTILNSGKEQMAKSSDWMNFCQVGSGNNFPLDLIDRQNETSLENHIDGTATITITTNGQSGIAPYYGWKRKVFRFAPGLIGGQNINEVGVGWGLTGSTLISRAQILDPVSGNPTTVTPLIDELLDVSYELRYYAPIGDVIGPQVTLFGVVYDTITRAAFTTGDTWSQSIGAAIGKAGNYNEWRATDDVIGLVTTGPSGVSADCDNSDQFNSAYVNNSYQIQVNSHCGSLGWNLAGYIRSLVFETTAGSYQTQFSSNPGGNPIPKDALYYMDMGWIIGWAEKV